MEVVSEASPMVDDYWESKLAWENEWLKQLLERYKGNVTHAARASGVDLRTLHRMKSKQLSGHAKEKL